MQTMDDALYDLYMRKLIDADNAVTYAQDPVSMNKKVSFDFWQKLDLSDTLSLTERKKW